MASSDPLPIQLVLYQPEIPPNTGNLIRLCSNTGIGLHLIEPLGFSLEEKALRRAGLDYHETAALRVHANFEAFMAHLHSEDPTVFWRIFAITTKGSIPYTEPKYQLGDVFLFGPETRGLPDNLLSDPRIANKIRIPMRPSSRSLNLSNAAAIVAYEALRQQDFPKMV